MERVILLGVGACAGILAGFLLWGPESFESGGAETGNRETAPPLGSERASGETGPGGSTSLQDRQEIDDLRADWAAERDRADQLADKLNDLREVFGAALIDPDAADADTLGVQLAKGEWFDEDILRASGFDAREIESLRERFDEIELERLFIRDEATRDGWLKTQRFWNEMVELQKSYDDLREEYGDDAYDWILYAAGRTNRVEATSVLQKSPAADAGIEAGDVILAYGDVKILTPAELKAATTAAEYGENVAVDVRRGEEELRFFLPGGAIGIQLAPISREPTGGR